MDKFQGRFFLRDPFGEILFQIRKLVRLELPQTPSIQHELFSFAPASLLRDPKIGNVFSDQAWKTPIPMLIVKFQESDAINARNCPRFARHGIPLLALLWTNSPENNYLMALLKTFSIPWLQLDRDNPITWSTKAVRDFIDNIRQHAETAPLISSRQFDVAKRLADLENTASNFFNDDSSERVVVQQEISMSSVIGFEGDYPPPILDRGSFDFVLFADIFSGSDADRIRGAKWTPVLAIEYDGKSNHATVQQQESDRRKNEICRLAGLPLLRVSYRHLGIDSTSTSNDISFHERELNSRILSSTFFHSVTFPKTKQRRDRVLRSIYREAMQKTPDKGQAIQSIFDWFQEISDADYFDHLIMERQLRLHIGEDISIGLEQDTAGFFYGIVKDGKSGKKRWRSPSLRLELHGAAIDGEKLAKKILVDWIWDKELTRHGINPDDVPIPA